MKYILFITALLGFVGLCPNPGFADARAVTTPYLLDGTSDHPNQWRRMSWDIAAWTETPEQASLMLNHFYQIGVFDQYQPFRTRRAPTVQVGPGFYRLSGFDQRRVLALFDYVTKATAKTAGTLFLEDSDTGKVIGLYTPWGLQLQ